MNLLAGLAYPQTDPTLGNTGDDGPATDAQLHEPAGIAATPDGGFLIADVLNNEVRKISAD